MRWACDNAAGATDISGVADKIHSALAGDPPYDPPSSIFRTLADFVRPGEVKLGCIMGSGLIGRGFEQSGRPRREDAISS